MKDLLESNRLPKLNQDEIQNQNKPSKEIASVIRRGKKQNTAYRKTPGPDGFIGECWQMLKELTAILHRLLKIKMEEHFWFVEWGQYYPATRILRYPPTSEKWNLSQECKVGLTSEKQVICYIKRMKD